MEQHVKQLFLMKSSYRKPVHIIIFPPNGDKTCITIVLQIKNRNRKQITTKLFANNMRLK